jgi:hypothetical protein
VLLKDAGGAPEGSGRASVRSASRERVDNGGLLRVNDQGAHRESVQGPPYSTLRLDVYS